MSSTFSDNLRLINCRVREMMFRLQPGQAADELSACRELESLLAELTRTAAWLRRVPPAALEDVDLAQEISDYRQNLEQLQTLLPTIQQQLLATKIRLELAGNHVTAARAWANASQGTL
ncbi:MAG TPA: hypothetical protein VHS34_13420 [Terriglobales bacterium]|jgi:hypothetical protein|nr:hypothetical protein [Terriglobales bacterium]